jgi:glycosyltransferase involved in cell wall biosynthesis
LTTRACHVLHLLPDLNTGGGQIVVLRLIEAMRDFPHRHMVCYVKPAATMRRQFEASGIETVGLNLGGVRDLPRAMWRLASLVKHHRIDVIHANNTVPDLPIGLLLSLFTRATLFNTLHTVRPLQAPTPFRQLLDKARQRVMSRLVSRYFVVSEAAFGAWRQHLRELGVPKRRLRVLSPGVDLRQ